MSAMTKLFANAVAKLKEEKAAADMQARRADYRIEVSVIDSGTYPVLLDIGSGFHLLSREQAVELMLKLREAVSS